MPPSGGSSAPQGASTNFPGQPASVYTPTAQGPADSLFQQIVGLNGSTTGIPNNPAQTPAATFYPSSTAVTQDTLGPYYSQLSSNLQGQYPYAGELYQQAFAGAGQLGAAGSQILNTAFDPQQALYNQTLNQTQQQSAAANANSGVGGTPYGQITADNATNNFNINWQNQQLQRQIAGGQAATGLDQGAQTLYGQGLQTFMGPENALSQLANNYNSTAGAAANLGNNQYLLPQQVLNDLQSYLGLGQSSSQISGQLGQMGVNENLAQQQLQMQQLGQFGQAAGGLSSLALGNQGLSSGLSGLFGGSGAAAGTSALIPGTTAALTGSFPTASFADLLPATALT